MLCHNRRTDALDYLQTMLRELRTMAAAERCDMVTYLIEMAYVEVSDVIRGERPMNVAQTIRRKRVMKKIAAETGTKAKLTPAA